jgi:hypothetical protein
MCLVVAVSFICGIRSELLALGSPVLNWHDFNRLCIKYKLHYVKNTSQLDM